MSSEASEGRRLISDTGWFQWVKDEEAEGAADIIIRCADLNEILRQLSPGEIRRLASQLSHHSLEALQRTHAVDRSFFASYHTAASTLQHDPRQLWGSRTQQLDTQPEPLIRPR